MNQNFSITTVYIIIIFLCSYVKIPTGFIASEHLHCIYLIDCYYQVPCGLQQFNEEPSTGSMGEFLRVELSSINIENWVSEVDVVF